MTCARYGRYEWRPTIENVVRYSRIGIVDQCSLSGLRMSARLRW